MQESEFNPDMFTHRAVCRGTIRMFFPFLSEALGLDLGFTPQPLGLLSNALSRVRARATSGSFDQRTVCSFWIRSPQPRISTILSGFFDLVFRRQFCVPILLSSMTRILPFAVTLYMGPHGGPSCTR